MITVFGTITIDISMTLDRLPEPGETVLGGDHVLAPGGKGANQALAAARAGAKVALVGKVGQDDMGAKATTELRRAGVLTSGVAKSDNPTGIAFIMRSDNNIKRTVVCSGANMESIADQIPEEILGPDYYVMLQMELNYDENIALLEKAKEHGATTFLNLVPAVKLSDAVLKNIDYLILNRVEARQIAEKMGHEDGDNAVYLSKALASKGHLTCIVTRGPEGSVATTPEGKTWIIPVLDVPQDEIMDSTGSGDAYCGTLAASLKAGLKLPSALKRASAAASLTCLEIGSQAAMPYSDDIEERLNDMPDPEILK